MHALTAFIAAVGRWLRRLVLVLAGTAIVLFTVVFGTALALAVVAWAKLRGRPVLNVHRFGRRAGRAAEADVIDIEAREVERPGQPASPSRETARALESSQPR